MQQETKASLILLVIPILWGITFPLIEKVVVNHNPSVFVFWRFITAALILMPAAINSIKVGKFCWADLRYGLLLGI